MPAAAAAIARNLLLPQPATLPEFEEGLKGARSILARSFGCEKTSTFFDDRRAARAWSSVDCHLESHSHAPAHTMARFGVGRHHLSRNSSASDAAGSIGIRAFCGAAGAGARVKKQRRMRSVEQLDSE
jgi:hypothetical protein